eukprot:scaffold63104_cov56-Phaeocystis_antarctica.AAC.3
MPVSCGWTCRSRSSWPRAAGRRAPSWRCGSSTTLTSATRRCGTPAACRGAPTTRGRGKRARWWSSSHPWQN